MRRFLIFVALAAIVTTLPLFNSSASAPVTVIVELRDDPGAVYKARTERSGGSVSDEQLQAYRNQLRVKQDEFLSALSSSGVSATAIHATPRIQRSVAANVPLRYTLVLNGIALSVPNLLSRRSQACRR